MVLPGQFACSCAFLALCPLLTSLASTDTTRHYCVSPGRLAARSASQEGARLSGTFFLTFESLRSGSQVAVWGLSLRDPAEVNRAGGLELRWCGLAGSHRGGALPGALIGQHLLCSIESWSGQGCELFNAYLGSVPWLECPRGCSRSFRKDLYLMLVTFLGPLPPSEICKRYHPFPPAGGRLSFALLCWDLA